MTTQISESKSMSKFFTSPLLLYIDSNGIPWILKLREIANNLVMHSDSGANNLHNVV